MKKGFTLIELLAVLVIMGVIALITMVSVADTIDNSKNKTKDIQQNEVIKAARQYFISSDIDLDTNGSTCINTSDLINNGYFENSEVIDPTTNEQLQGSVLITYDGTQYKYVYQNSVCKN